jgi:hypothetical protein
MKKKTDRYEEAKKFKLNKQEGPDCWRVAISNYLQMSPDKIPDFVNEFPNDWVKATRDWLKKKFKKGIVFITSTELETNGRNKLPYPDGRCIVCVEDTLEPVSHAIFMYNGLLLQKHTVEKYDKVLGYFIIYDL